MARCFSSLSGSAPGRGKTTRVFVCAYPGLPPHHPRANAAAFAEAGANHVCFCLRLSRLASSSSPGKCSRICGGRGRPRAFLPGFVPACLFIISGQMQPHLRGPGQTACVFVCVCPGLDMRKPARYGRLVRFRPISLWGGKRRQGVRGLQTTVRFSLKPAGM